MTQDDLERATLAGGCFWCLEAAFKALDGVHTVTSGYAGGHVENPTYKEVCNGTTGHAEVVQVAYDSDVISYPELLEVFFSIHNPTTKDRQGPDIGSQYRSAVYYHDEEQRDIVEDYIADLDASDVFEDPIVTEVEPLDTFYEADEYHQDYYARNPDQAYCQVNIHPKLQKLRTEHEEKLAN